MQSCLCVVHITCFKLETLIKASNYIGSCLCRRRSPAREDIALSDNVAYEEVTWKPKAAVHAGNYENGSIDKCNCQTNPTVGWPTGSQ